MVETKEKLKISKWELEEIQFNQDYLVQLTKKIYLLEIDKEYEVKSNQQDQFSIDQQKNDEWKIKQDFIEQLHRNNYSILLKNSHLIMGLRKRLKSQKFIEKLTLNKKDWQSQHDRIAGEMQKMLKRIDELQESITQEANLNKRELQLKEMDETTQQLDEYIQNISADFVNHIRKGLLRVEGKINQIKEQLTIWGMILNIERKISYIIA